ncbi:MAG: SDR family oxidoreductase [Acidimicrobiia bacterium]|jgi:NAD(P)-dependent dehydrogenase (short-subunit alcohol dehydrogenase family)
MGDSPGQLLPGRVVAVTGADQPYVRGLAAGLTAAGAVVATVATDALGSRADAEAAFGAVAAEHGPLAGVVHASIDPIAYERVPMHEVDDARWDAVWEQTLRRTLFVLQAGHTRMRAAGGAFVVVTPVVGMAGAAELAPYAAAMEGVRVLAKAAARQWGAVGIRVNCLAPAPEQVPVGIASGALALSPPALGGPGDPEADLAPVAAWLLSDGAHFCTGLTLSVDGGVWMAP